MKTVQNALHRLFKSDLKVQSVRDIKPETLRSLGVKTIAVDADNTTSHDRTTTPLPGAEEWIKELKKEGFKIVLLSNAATARAKVLADQYDITPLGLALKPLPFGYIRVALRTRTMPQKICMIGDQLFTDIMGANICGFKSIYVFPYAKETRNAASFAARRFLERQIFRIQDKKQGESVEHTKS